MALLARLAHGAGVVVVTGPMGRLFWSLASPEVRVKVEPDGYEYKDRLSIREWSAHLGGVPTQHIKKDTGHKGYKANWQTANSYRRKMSKLLRAAEPIIEVEFPSQVVESWDALDSLFAREEFVAYDWEWDRETKLPLGLACSGRVDNLYLTPVTVADRDTFRSRMLGGGIVLHVAKADIGTQWPADRDPIELVVSPPHDTSVMAYLLGEKVLKLKVLARTRLGRDPLVYDDVLVSSPEMAARYAAGGDTRSTYDLWRQMVPLLVESGQWEVYNAIERPLIPVLASMERYGMPVDMAAVWRHYLGHIAIERGLRQAVLDHYGCDLRSDVDTRRLLLEQTGFDPGSVDQRLLSLNPSGYVDLILEYRHHRTRRRGFLAGTIKRWLAAGRPDEFRVYPHYNQASDERGESTAPETGRLSSADPNMQNQPGELRDIYVAPPGYNFFAFDYGAVELRIAAFMSGDPTMLAGLAEGGDLHTTFQHRITTLTGKDVGRKAAKEGNFEQLYGGGAATLQKLLAKKRAFLDLAGCQAIVDAHADTFPVYHQWARDVVERARRLGYAETAFGRRRLLPGLYSIDPVVRQHAERAAVSHTVQGTAADIIKMAMGVLAWIVPQFDAHMATTVHDEVAGWVSKDTDWELFKAVVISVMQSVAMPGLRLVVEGKTGETWKDCK